MGYRPEELARRRARDADYMALTKPETKVSSARLLNSTLPKRPAAGCWRRLQMY